MMRIHDVYYDEPYCIWCTYTGLGIHSFAHSLFTLSLKNANFKEQPWAIHFCGSLKKNDSEEIALVAL